MLKEDISKSKKVAYGDTKSRLLKPSPFNKKKDGEIQTFDQGGVGKGDAALIAWEKYRGTHNIE